MAGGLSFYKEYREMEFIKAYGMTVQQAMERTNTLSIDVDIDDNPDWVGVESFVEPEPPEPSVVWVGAEDFEESELSIDWEGAVFIKAEEPAEYNCWLED